MSGRIDETSKRPMKVKCISLVLMLSVVASVVGFAFAPTIKFAPNLPLTLARTSPLVRSRPITLTAAEPTAVEQGHHHVASVVWTGSRDHRWSNQHNWKGGRVPGPSDVARFIGRPKKSVVVDAANTSVAGIFLAEDYAGSVTLNCDLSVSGDLVLAGGTINQGHHSLRVGRYRQTGGKFVGDAELTISGSAQVSGGKLLSGRLINATSLTIDSPGVVTMSTNSKLLLTGDGSPLNGTGLLDTRSNASNSIEYTGRVTSDVTEAEPIKRGLAGYNLESIGGSSAGKPKSFSIRIPPSVREFASENSISPLAPGFSRIASLTLTKEEDYPWSAVIDTANGFAYFGTLTSPGIVVKVRLSDFTRVGALVLNTGENDLRSAVIDSGNGFAYFGSLSGHVVKVRLSDFTRIDSFDVGGPLAAAVIDAASGFAYFGAYTGPGAVVKVRLADFVAVDVLILDDAENGILSAVIDPVNGFAYFGTSDNPGKVVKVRLSDFTRVSAATLNFNEDELTCGVIDVAHGFAYFGNFDPIGSIVKVRLSDMTRVAGFGPNDGTINFLRSAVIDTVNGFAYFGDSYGAIHKMRLSDFTRVGILNSPSEELLCAVIDVANGFAYFGALIPLSIVKIRLSDFTVAGSVALSTGEDNLTCAVIDTANGFAYFGTGTTPGLVVKIRLSDFTQVGVLILPEWGLQSAVLDAANGFAYFGTGSSPGKVIKVRLSDFTRVDAITLNAGESELFSAVIDTLNGFAYFGAIPYPKGRIIKIRLSDFTRVNSLILNDDERPRVGVIDAANGFAYFGAYVGVVIKVQLADLTRVGAVTISQDQFLSAVADPTNGFAYFGTYGGSIARLRFSDFSAAGTLNLNSGENNLQSAAIDTNNGFAYFGTFTTPGRIVEVRLSDFSRVDGITLLPGEDYLSSAVADPNNGFAYFGSGTLPGKIIKVGLGGSAPTPTPTPIPTPTPTPTPTPSPSPGPLRLILEESGILPNQAAALDSILYLRDPFLVVNPNNFLNPSADKNTRVVVFAANLHLILGQPPSSVIVNLVDSNNQSYDIPAEDVRPVPNFTFVQIVFKLPDHLPAGTCLITVKAHGETSNTGAIRIRP